MTPWRFCHLAEVRRPGGRDGAVVPQLLHLGRGGRHLTWRICSSARDFGGRGLARALLATLARECVDNGYSRLSWAVLDWNIDAIALYDAVGGRQMSEWITYRVSGAGVVGAGSRVPPSDIHCKGAGLNSSTSATECTARPGSRRTTGANRRRRTRSTGSSSSLGEDRDPPAPPPPGPQRPRRGQQRRRRTTRTRRHCRTR